jgi:Sulfotransferase family
MLRFLQWQKRQRGLTAQRWVLKSPAHLGYLDTLRTEFPDPYVVHMHRDPRITIASGASLNAALHGMHADTVDTHRVGAQWLERMGWTNDRAMAVRDGWADDDARVTDVHYDDAVADPIGQAARVYDAIGLPLTSDASEGMRRWLAGDPAKYPGRPTTCRPMACAMSRSTSGLRSTTSGFDKELQMSDDPVATVSQHEQDGG